MLFGNRTIVIARALAAGFACAVATSASFAQSVIDLTLVGPTAPVVVNQIIDVKLRANQVNQSFTGTSFVAIDCIIKWNPKQLQLMGLTTTGSVPLLSSYFPTPASDYTGINEAAPPTDGDALYYALAPLGNPVQVSAAGVQVTTFRFKVKTAFTSASVSILPTLNIATPTDTIVYDGTVPGLNVLGAVHPATIVQTPPCVGDIDRNGAVNAQDMAALLSQWGGPGSADIDGNGTVNANDLSMILSNWGPCPGT